MSGKIFISYRREDSRGAAGRIYDRLAQNFGHRKIFMDVDAIEPGDDFVQAIENAVSSTDIFLVVIGPDWLNTTDNSGNRRLDNPEDFVRLEVASALRRDVRVIPVLVDKATMPRSIDLPEDLKPLTRRNAIEISHTRFSMDMDRLLRSITLAFDQIASDEKSGEKKVIHVSQQSPQVNKKPAQYEQGQQKAGHQYQIPDEPKQKKRKINWFVVVVVLCLFFCACACIATYIYIDQNYLWCTLFYQWIPGC